MKSEVNPVVAGVVIVILVAVVGFFLWRGSGGGSNKAPGSVGNPGPFSPGGAAVGKGGKPGTGAAGGMPGSPANPAGR